MKKDLINRYIFAVQRHLPKNSKEEVSKEVLSLIDEMLNERCGQLAPTEDDIVFVLKKLGKPDKLALKYMGKEDIALISGTSLLLYKRLLILVLPIVAAAIIGGFILAALLEGNPSVLISLWGAIVTGVLVAFALITITAAICDKYKNESKDDFIAGLPVSPQEKKQIPLYEPIGHIVMVVIFALFLLAFPQLISGRPDGIGERIPLFNVANMRSLWYMVALFALIDVAIQIFKIYERKYTKKLAIIHVIGSVLMLALITILFANKSIINLEFMNVVATAEQAGEVGSKVLKTLHWQILGWVYLVIIVDIVSVIKKILYKTMID